MRTIRIQNHYRKGTVPDGTTWKVFDAETGKLMPEVQAVSYVMSVDDSMATGTILWLDFSPYDAGCTDKEAIEAAAKGELREVTEIVRVAGIDMKEID